MYAVFPSKDKPSCSAIWRAPQVSRQHFQSCAVCASEYDDYRQKMMRSSNATTMPYRPMPISAEHTTAAKSAGISMLV